MAINIDELAVLVRGGAVTPSKLLANHNALGQLTNQNTFRFSGGGPSLTGTNRVVCVRLERELL